MKPRGEQEPQTGLSEEQLLALSGLTVAVRTSVIRFWREAMPEGPESVPVAVASVEFDKTGRPAALGVRHSEILRAIKEHGDVQSASARQIALEQERVLMVTPDGKNMYVPKPAPRAEAGVDVFDAPYI